MVLASLRAGVVWAQPVAIQLTSNPSAIAVGQPVTFTATVTPATATGTVTFKDGVTTLGTVTIVRGTARLTTGALSGTPRSTPAFAAQCGASGSNEDALFDSPFGVAVDGSGNVYVADGSNNRIQKFDAGGRFLMAWGSEGPGNGQFQYPAGLALDTAGNVYVADYDNHRIQKFDANGTFLLAWGSDGSGGGRFEYPSGVAVDAAGNVYVADFWGDSVEKFDATGKFLARWGSSGKTNGQFSIPMGLAVDRSGNVYVADSNNNRVQKFDAAGRFLLALGTAGSGNGQLRRPFGVAVDQDGLVYVVEAGGTRMQKFDASGQFLLAFGGPAGAGRGQFRLPSGVAVEGNASVYVVDHVNNCIQTFLSATHAITAVYSGDSRYGGGISPVVSVVVNPTNPTVDTETENLSYFAEGATINGFFQTRFALLNPDTSTPANVTMDFQLNDSSTVLTHTLAIGPKTRATVDVGDLGTRIPALAALRSAEFSTVVRSDRPLVADRTMTWDGSGYGSHAETAITRPASRWYFAEGATVGGLELYYLVQNPNPTPLTYVVTYLLPAGAPIVRNYTIGANTRSGIAVHLEPGLADAEVSAIIQSPDDKPIIAERAMYLTSGGRFYNAGHGSAGIPSPERRWYFAEGATGEFFDLFILIGNPNTSPAHVVATFNFDDGTTCTAPANVAPLSRYNIWVDATFLVGCPRSLDDAAVSTTLTSDIPVIAERAMWWPGPTAANWAEAHNTAGAPTTGTLWAAADGEVGNARNTETYLLVLNTSGSPGTARVTLYFEDGSTTQRDVAIPATSRTNVAIAAEFGALVADKRFGATVESLAAPGQATPPQIVVERAMYSSAPGTGLWSAGTDIVATRLR